MKVRTKRQMLAFTALALGAAVLGLVVYSVYLNSSLQTATALASNEYKISVSNSGANEDKVDVDYYNTYLWKVSKDEFDTTSISLEEIKKDEVTISLVAEVAPNTVLSVTSENIEKYFYWVELNSTLFYSLASLVSFGNVIEFDVTNKSADFGMSVMSTMGTTTVNETNAREWDFTVMALDDNEPNGTNDDELGFAFAYIPSVNYQFLILVVTYNDTANAGWISEMPSFVDTTKVSLTGNSAYIPLRMSFHGQFTNSIKFASSLGTDFEVESLGIAYSLDNSAIVCDTCV